MPLYEFACGKCGKTQELLLPLEHESPACCNTIMRRVYSGRVKIKVKYPLWVDRIDDIHKAQEQRGERLRYVYPQEVGAS